jgi:endo-beta-N-acetylglucosaminidase D
MFMMSAQEVSYGENQPYASYWFVENLLEWNPEKDKSAKFNTSIIPLASRFLNDSVSLGKGASKIPSIISLIAPHSTSNHPSQGFPSVKQYAFPYWQYIDYYVQWGGSANEGIIVPPLATWTDVAHRNGVKSIGTVFFPPNVYGGKEEWVYEFLVQRTDGSFPVADKLIEVANAYNFDGWFINQETYDLKDGIAEKMIAFLEYYKKNSNLKMVWYDAMIDDSRVIWQDELNNHNQVFFQKGAQKMSDVFFINFRYNPVNLEDSKKAAKALDRSEWDLYAGIDVQSRGYKTPIQWDALFNEETPKNTSIGLYWPNSTFDLSETKEPEDVYSKEQKFWNGGTEIETRFGKSKWRGFVNYFEPRSVINKLPFTTNFNYGLGRFYKEKGETVSDKEWHNLSVQDILPTWQWKVDSLKVKPTISFKDSYEGGSSLFLEGKSDAKIPLYKTNISLDKTVLFEVIAKSVGNMQLQFYYTLTNGEKIKFKLKRSSSWKKTSFTISSKKGIFITSVGVESSGVGDAFLGEISAYYKKPQKLPGTKFTAEVFKKVDTAEVYLHFEENTAEFHKIYAVLPNNEKVWLGKTPSQDYYISNAPIQNGYIHLATEPVGPGRVTGKLFYKKIRVD